jgi:hypothetical protein
MIDFRMDNWSLLSSVVLVKKEANCKGKPAKKWEIESLT